MAWAYDAWCVCHRNTNFGGAAATLAQNKINDTKGYYHMIFITIYYVDSEKTFPGTPSGCLMRRI